MDSASAVPARAHSPPLQRRSRSGRERVSSEGSVAVRHASQGAGRLVARVSVIALVVLAFADILAGIEALHQATRVLSVIVAGSAALLAAAAAEPAGPSGARRWHLQAGASALVMVLLMANVPAHAGEVLWFVIVVGAASALVALATTFRATVPTGLGALCLVLDAAIVGFTMLLITLALADGVPGTSSAALLLGAFGAAGFAVAVATRPSIRVDPYGADALFLGAVAVLCLHVGGEASRLIGFGMPSPLAAPGVALIATVGLARSAWRGTIALPKAPPTQPHESRLRLVPALAAAVAIIVLSWAELIGLGSRAGFFGVILLFGLIVGRLLVTLVENRQLLQRVERSGLFEERLRELGDALVAVLDRKDTLELVCRTAQTSLAADSVILWMHDATANELEAVEVISPKRDPLLLRRLTMDDPTALAVRVARTGTAEIVANVPNANLSNAYLNVLLHTQALLAVPVLRGDAVQGVLVCIDSRNPTAYGVGELQRAELLASQMAVALDIAYQHALQQRRLEELSALYQFAQSAHAALSSTEIVRLLLPIVKERLGYATGTIWLREDPAGSLRAVATDGHAEARGLRPSQLALRACAAAEPARAGLEWDEVVQPAQEHRTSQLAVPMVIQRRVVGVVDLVSAAPHAYSPIEERLLVALANHAALAVDNLHLLEETRKVEALRELDRMKTELLGTVSHELRTPLGSIKGYATTLLTHGNRLAREERREFLEIIDSEADRLRELIENLLDMSRLEAGVLRIDRQPAHLGKLVSDCMRKVELATPKHQFELSWPEPDPLTRADSKRIYQVVQNLLTNAVKYSPDGGTIRLSAHCERHELVVCVQDDGLGMPATELDRIFDRFHRVSGEVSHRIGGTGLGLAICKGLVDAHGGRIWAESEGEGKGSVFKFTLPLLAPLES